METRAHYILVGAFVIAVLAAAFISVIWLVGAQFQRQHAVQSKHAHVLAQVTPAHHVPTPAMVHDAVRIDFALRFVVAGAIAQPRAAVVLRRRAQGNEAQFWRNFYPGGPSANQVPTGVQPDVFILSGFIGSQEYISEAINNPLGQPPLPTNPLQASIT